jgi:hypothetical protein
MPFALQYNKLIARETQVAKTKLEPRKVYKIISYEYADGNLTTFTGPKSAIIFVIGITPDKILHCLKISESSPRKFFSWLRLNLKRNLKYETIVENVNSNKFNEIVLDDNRLGTKFFQEVKRNTIYTQQPGTYRTYILKNVKLIKEVTFDTKEMLRLLGIPKPSKTTTKPPEE